MGLVEKAATIMSTMYVVVIYIIYGMVFGIATNKVIENKGWNENWFIWGFLFGIIALIVAVAKPENRELNNEKVVLHEKEIIKKYCDKCQKEVHKGLFVCPTCGSDLRSVYEIPEEKPQESVDIEVAEKRSIDVEELRECKKLLDEGIITQADFDKKKQQVLGV
jgi:uncharacterized Zn finger protein (UPF0148 family)